MDLPDIPEALAVFAALATSRAAAAGGEDDCSHRGGKGKKGKGKGKGKRKRKGGGKDDDSAPIRPCDPLPAVRRMRLESLLQPISTMLDACTVTRAVPAAGDVGGAGGGGDDGGTNAQSGGTANGFHVRAYDGTLADFMGFALVEHFASRLPRTLAALFEDFERHPPDLLTAALAAASCSAPSGGCAAVAVAGDGGQAEEKTGRTKEAAPPGVDVGEPAAASSGEYSTGKWVYKKVFDRGRENSNVFF